MRMITIWPEQTESPNASFRAVAHDAHARGASPGAALDALTQQLDPVECGTLIVLQNLRPAPPFTAAQQQRLAELMAEWRFARDKALIFPADRRTELEELIAAELKAAQVFA